MAREYKHIALSKGVYKRGRLAMAKLDLKSWSELLDYLLRFVENNQQPTDIITSPQTPPQSAPASKPKEESIKTVEEPKEEEKEVNKEEEGENNEKNEYQKLITLSKMLQRTYAIMWMQEKTAVTEQELREMFKQIYEEFNSPNITYGEYRDFLLNGSKEIAVKPILKYENGKYVLIEE